MAIDLKAVPQWMQGKKTLIGSLLLSLIGAAWSLDVLIDGKANWLTEGQYVAIGTFIAGLTGAAMRIAVGKSISGQQAMQGVIDSMNVTRDVNSAVNELRKDEAK